MTATTTSSSLSARRVAASVLLATITVLIVIADQVSKIAIQRHFETCIFNTPETLVPGWLSLAYTCNTGAAFGVLADRTVLFIAIAIVVIGVIIAYLTFLPTDKIWMKLALSLQLGGALGNLIDRLREGYVIDFIAVKSFPVFNIADSCIVIGVMILGYYLCASKESLHWSKSSDPPSQLSA